uniref:(2Fe-2S) ferredoxin domain-containing protein n=1 Tax=Archaeoglobus fulgidus TaxID=2234 RepID=A0A7C2SE46_ARCFL
MRIGVKYCGGCNPDYRREEVEEVLRKHFKIFYSEDAEILVLINGCRKACLLDEVKHPRFSVVDSQLSEEEIVSKVEKAMKKLLEG